MSMKTNKVETVGQHTPGPWKTIGPAIFRDDKPIAETDGSELSRIATVVDRTVKTDYPLDDVQDEESAANARLIAAAPELLAALREALPFAESQTLMSHGGEPEHSHTTDRHQAVSRARAAIARATK